MSESFSTSTDAHAIPQGVSDLQNVTYPHPISEYEVAYVAGLKAYAWWKDGVEYVGTAGTTFETAKSLFLAARRRRCSCAEYGGQSNCEVHGEMASHGAP